MTPDSAAVICFAGGLVLIACLLLVSMGCRAIVSLCGQLERDRRTEYKIPANLRPKLERHCPSWLGRATGRASR